jgi:hypothetical protein
MKLSELARKPQLIPMVIDDQDIRDTYGDVIEFWTWDRQPMSSFMKLANVDAQDTGTMLAAVRDLVLDETGQPMLTGETSLPAPVLMRVITRVIGQLGK